jgi:hypothetical protein
MRKIAMKDCPCIIYMDNMYIISGVISFVYFLGKFIEMRFIEKESKPLKVLVKDTLLVYVCTIIAFIRLEQLKPILQEASGGGPVTQIAFTDNPTF